MTSAWAGEWRLSLATATPSMRPSLKKCSTPSQVAACVLVSAKPSASLSKCVINNVDVWHPQPPPLSAQLASPASFLILGGCDGQPGGLSRLSDQRGLQPKQQRQEQWEDGRMWEGEKKNYTSRHYFLSSLVPIFSIYFQGWIYNESYFTYSLLHFCLSSHACSALCKSFVWLFCLPYL